MLVSQIQSCGNANLPSRTQLGVASLHIAEVIASLIGFEEIKTYTARGHPLFYEHPDSRGQLQSDFVCLWDASAKKLGFNGSRNGNSHHSKRLVRQTS